MAKKIAHKAVRISAPCRKPRLGDRFPEYLDGLLRPAEVSEVEKHVHECAQCRLELNMWVSAMEADTKLGAVP